MKIATIDVYKLDVEYTRPTRTPIGTITASRNVAVRITSDSGLIGWGEASPFAPITGDSQDTNIAAARTIAELLKGRDPLAIEARMREIDTVTVRERSIRGAFDMALYDVLGKAAGLPLYALLGGERRALSTDVTVGIQDSTDTALALIEGFLKQGYQALKLKVGRPGGIDVEYVEAVRKLAGPNIALRIDANQGWSFPDAVQVLRAVDGLNLQYVEQPLAAWDFAGLENLRAKVNVPVCADESVFDHRDAFKLTSRRAVDYLNIKLGKSGGIHEALKINAVAEAAGCRCMIGCFAESRLALSAAAHLAMARPNIAFLDLDSALNQKTDPVIGGMTYDKRQGGVIHLPAAPGHGATFDESALIPQFQVGANARELL